MSKNRLIYRLFSWFLIFLSLLAFLYIFGRVNVAFGPSMEPTLYSGDRILIDRKAYEAVKPAKDDIVAFPAPRRGAFYIKRVVAEEGDEVKITSEGVRVNSKLKKNTEGPWSYNRFTLEENKVFVLGDNGYNSEDSREFGPVKANTIVGKVKYVIWPPSRWGFVK
ncbi:MAG: signal peptidase I [Actinobacteria bacterium]|nr:MAG: signal peptidase I [Actinomycetota bacterium]